MKLIQFSSDDVMTFQQCSNMNHCLRELKRDENYDLAVGGFSQHLRYLPQFSATDIFCFDKSESLISYPISLIVKVEQKTIIDTVIRRLLEFGIIRKLKVDIQRMKKVHGEIAEDAVPSTLRFEHVYCVFVTTYGIGISFSILIWLFELFVDKRLRSPRAHRFWYFIERCIDGQRHYFKNLPERLRNKFDQEHQTRGTNR